MTAAAIDVIVVEDDEALRTGLVQALELEGLNVRAFEGAAQALRSITPEFAGVVISDVRMPGMDGIAFFSRLREIDPDLQVIFTTAHGDVDMAVDAMKSGAADFFTKPYSVSRLVHSIARAGEKRALLLENRRLRNQLDSRARSGWIGQSAATERLERTVNEVARTEADVLLTGDEGTGKSFLARMIHEASPRSSRPLVVIDPGILANAEADLLLYGRAPSVALSRSGLIERASGGTLVLEDIDLVPEPARARLISLIENRTFHAIGAERPQQVDVRVIGTTSRPAGGSGGVWPGGLSLERRLGGVTIALPRLIERREDIPELFRTFVGEFERLFERTAGELTQPDLHFLLTHDWPGNLRELRVFAQNFVLGLTSDARAHLPGDDAASLRDLLANYEKSVLEDALRRANGNVTQVERSLSIARKTLYDKLTRYGIRPKAFRQ